MCDDFVTRGAWRQRILGWLRGEAFPCWSNAGVDEANGGFFEALAMDGSPLVKPKRMRTMARQVYAFALARSLGWDGDADRLIAHGIDFMSGGRTARGGWARALGRDGAVIDGTEDAYDHACVLLALALSHEAGHPSALRLGDETFAFLDEHLEDPRLSGYLETTAGCEPRRSNPHMHLLEAFLAWYRVTGSRDHLRRAARVVDHFRTHFFDVGTWTVGEYFAHDWRPASGEQGDWIEPGHHFEWAALLVDFSAATGQADLVDIARKLYTSALALGINRKTGLAYGAVSRIGKPLDPVSRTWPQSEAVRAAICLDAATELELGAEVEARVERLFHWHIDPAPSGLWLDRIDATGRDRSEEVPASILYHLVTALGAYVQQHG